MEVEFMIDTGCPVTILATSVFERMCAADPQVRSRLRPCGRRLVSADSSPLTVKGELGLSCDMLFVVASIGSDGLLVQKPCSRVCHISQISEQGSYGPKAVQHYNYINRD